MAQAGVTGTTWDKALVTADKDALLFANINADFHESQVHNNYANKLNVSTVGLQLTIDTGGVTIGGRWLEVVQPVTLTVPTAYKGYLNLVVDTSLENESTGEVGTPDYQFTLNQAYFALETTTASDNVIQRYTLADVSSGTSSTTVKKRDSFYHHQLQWEFNDGLYIPHAGTATASATLGGNFRGNVRADSLSQHNADPTLDQYYSNPNSTDNGIRIWNEADGVYKSGLLYTPKTNTWRVGGSSNFTVDGGRLYAHKGLTVEGGETIDYINVAGTATIATINATNIKASGTITGGTYKGAVDANSITVSASSGSNIKFDYTDPRETNAGMQVRYKSDYTSGILYSHASDDWRVGGSSTFSVNGGMFSAKKGMTVSGTATFNDAIISNRYIQSTGSISTEGSITSAGNAYINGNKLRLGYNSGSTQSVITTDVSQGGVGQRILYQGIWNMKLSVEPYQSMTALRIHNNDASAPSPNKSNKYGLVWNDEKLYYTDNEGQYHEVATTGGQHDGNWNF